jgi:aldehyde dehydrogenase (NAD+)
MFDNFIAGAWRPGASTIENRNPSDLSDVIGLYAQADPEQLAETLAAARAAQRIYAAGPLEPRYAALMAIGEELMWRADDLGALLSREEGKPRAEGVDEVYRSGKFFQYFAAEVMRQIGDTADSVRPGIEIDIRREPIGVVAVISPWNFPMATASWKIAPALAFGNAVVWKPANLTPASAVALTEIIDRQGLPKGLFSLVMGSGGKIGQALIESPEVDAISFTGSVEVGRRIAAASVGNLPKIQLEMGSKNPLVVMDDADLELAVQCALNGAYGGTGQKCTASSRLIVHQAVHDAFVERLTDAIGKFVIGHALAEGTQIGPVASADQLASNMAYLKVAEQSGCERVIGGERLERETEGYFMAPALLVGGTNDMRVNREEMFAPVACVIGAGSYEEALAMANDTRYGLTAGIVTQSLARATHFRRNVRAGCVMVNLPTAGTDYHVPFGGRGDSSHGPREQGRYAAEFYTQVKTAYISAGTPQ